MKHSNLYLGGMLILGLCAWNSPSAIAQEPVLVPPVPVPGTVVPGVQTPQSTSPFDFKWNILRIRNLKASSLAWLLDPKHAAEPMEFSNSRANFDAIRAPESLAPEMSQWRARGANPFDVPGQYRLPTGVMSVVPVDVQNALMVYANEAGLKALQEDLKTLDKPIRQVEVTATMVQVNFADLEKLTAGVALDEKGAATKHQHVMRDDYQKGLQTLVDAKKAVIKSAPRVLALNNLTSIIASVTGSPVEIGLRPLGAGDEKDKSFQPAFTTKQSGVFYLNRGIQFSATPRINSDNTITMLVAPEATLGLTSGSQNPTRESLKLPDLEGLQETVYVKDGGTIALRGLTTRFFDLHPLEKAPANASEVIVLVTANIVRRFGDERNIAGKQLVSHPAMPLPTGEAQTGLMATPVSAITLK